MCRNRFPIKHSILWYISKLQNLSNFVPKWSRFSLCQRCLCSCVSFKLDDVSSLARSDHSLSDRSCNAGTTLSTASGTGVCVPTDSDVNNCGAVGKVCAFPRGTGVCQSGQCTLTGCNAGSYDINGVCTALNIASDVNNWWVQLLAESHSDSNSVPLFFSGAVGKVCPSLNGQATCTNSQCGINCNTGYQSVNGVCTAINTATDVNNCGAVGTKCAASYANGINPTCSNGVCSATCNSGYAWDSTVLFCRPITSDSKNCGAIGKVCASANGLSSCNNGVCTLTTCNAGYVNVNGVCTSVNTQTDVNNCGTVGFTCPTAYAFGTGVSCVGGQCQATSCNAMYSWNPATKSCMSLAADSNNCGAIGKVCAYPNGQGSCVNGQCTTTSCNAGFQLVNGICTSMDITSDLNNCGAVGNKCTFPLGNGVCLKSTCTYTSCTGNYALVNGVCSAVSTSSDPKNCGFVGNVCPSYANSAGAAVCTNGQCSAVCNNGYAFDSVYNYCRQVTNDPLHWLVSKKLCSMTHRWLFFFFSGSCYNNCAANIPNSAATSCVNSACIVTSCQTGYNLVNNQCAPINVVNDVNNCGKTGNVCSFLPLGATGQCSAGQCVYNTCPSGWRIQANTCVRLTASQKAKRSKVTKPASLCPTGETACPILGSSSYEKAVNHHFSDMGKYSSGIMAGEGGYECLDTKQSLESCGGCASTGEGQDCTKIPSAVGVGCDAGVCVVFSCKAGSKPNLLGNGCVKSTSSHHSNSTAKRHLHNRQHAHSHDTIHA